MKRKKFIQLSAMGGVGLTLPFTTFLNSCKENSSPQPHSTEFRTLTFNLLRDWCNGLIQTQVMNPSDPKTHGMFICPACNKVHGRMMDAVYPLLAMAKYTGDKKYLESGIAVMEWAKNVTLPSGAWSNDLNPKSWNGITVFGAISLAEALHYHGDLLDSDRRQQWTDRLAKAADFVYKKFPSMDVTNVNYGATTIYALNLIGKMLNKQEYITRSKELAHAIKPYFTNPNHFLYGEIKPSAHKLSAKKLPGIDLGYNVEESLNNIVLYAVHENDKELLELLDKSLSTHLEFMLPDGGWDNGWGTRMFKWTYWGSRTCDGSQPALVLMADRNPALGTAAVKYTKLLKRCTNNGLLHGGLHYVSHGIKPCIHHTFAHSKPLAHLLDNWDNLPKISTSTPLPRSIANGIKHYKEIDTTLFARGDWRGTITAYDAIYKDGHYRQATGGAMSLLYHNKVGLLLAASMAEYKLVESLNQQPNPGEDFPFTPRVETRLNGKWYSNIFDRTAIITSKDTNGKISVDAQCTLKDHNNDVVQETASDFNLSYHVSENNVRVIAKTDKKITNKTTFVLPIISPSNEVITQVSSNEIIVNKPEGVVSITSSAALVIKETPKNRIFNMVPGAEAIPIMAVFKVNTNELEITIQVS
ncbi:hypothetical protein PXC01_08575 [Maribacter sp. M208]|uniref:hypothetical protein n=1 Tax=Maribacter huludaoensis TaxID=3030010 RepID=UPI0023ECDD9A|nr:hypothetical protein [Maribacter huludaoensis]MDF4221637.1 hypothetical protein [Maribacter huludaoensis]